MRRYFRQHRIFNAQELHARAEVALENYCKVLHIEALTMIDMARKQIVPAAMEYTAAVTQLAVGKQNLNLPAELERKTITQLSDAT